MHFGWNTLPRRIDWAAVNRLIDWNAMLACEPFRTVLADGSREWLRRMVHWNDSVEWLKGMVQVNGLGERIRPIR